MAKHEEVIIDSDSTEDDEEVRIVTPSSRKRRCRSNVMIDQGEEEEIEGEEEKDETTKTVSSVASSPASRHHLDRDSISTQHVALCTPTPVRRSRRNMQQLSISAAVARGDRIRHRQKLRENKKEDDDVCIIQPPSASSETRNERRSRRTTNRDSDEKLAPSEEEQQKTEGKVEVNDDKMSSASRRSSRIHCKHQKNAQHSGARKLDYPVLDNCLDSIQSRGPHDQDDDSNDDGNEDDDDGYEEADPVTPLLKKRRQSLLREGERDNCERVYADDGEDVDDFICDDDEIEYMDDDEEGVINVETSDDEVEDNLEEVTAMLAAGRSREVSEWFRIYLEYLEECIIDPDFENKMRRKRSKAKHQLYDQAVSHIERKLCSCRDTVRSGVAWPEEMVEALKCASFFRSSHVSMEQDCDACNRRQHLATYHVELTGMACDATKLYGHNWMRHLKKSVQEAVPVQLAFEMGSVCHARTLAYWQLLHAKQFWCILIDAKLKEHGTEHLAEPYWNDFFTKEFGRYKKLVGLVEKFAEDSKRATAYMPNVWEQITQRNVTSDFLPLPSSRTNAESRRGTLDAFVAESDEEGTEDEEAVMEKLEEEKKAANKDYHVTNEEEMMKERLSFGTPHSESKKEQKLQLNSGESGGKGGHLAKDVKEKDIDDLMCLVCDAARRDAGVVHGLYLHVYCCYACAKRQHRMELGCMVCNRPIDRVLRLLPLTLDARNAIRKQMS